MKYDDASWHYNGDFPKDLPIENGATHIAMFFAWVVEANLTGEIHLELHPDEIEQLRNHEGDYRQYFFDHCDGKLTNEDMNDVGNRFADVYYKNEHSKYYYYTDYSVAFENFETLYHVEASWENYEKLKPVIDGRFREWLSEVVSS